MDYYQILGVSKSATESEIKSAYRKLALKWHPDRNKEKGAEDEFKKITKAYETLSNKEKRANYDQLGHNRYEQYGGQAGAGQSQYSWNSSEMPFDFDFSQGVDPFDIFESIFGNGRSRRAKRDVYSVKITFEESYHGVEKDLVIKGQTKKIKIPAGVDSDNRIRFEDFDIEIRVEKSKKFRREGQDLIIEKELPYSIAVLGGNIFVDTVEKPIEIKVKAGTNAGIFMRLKNYGMPHLQSTVKGDLYVAFKIHVPAKISSKAKKILEELDKELSNG